MKTSDTLIINNDRFKFESKLVDRSNNKEVVTLTREILSNRDQDLTIDIGLITSDKVRSFKIHFRGNLYNLNEKVFYIDGNFHLNDITYSDKAHLEHNDDYMRIKLHCLMILDKSSSPTGYDFVYECKNNKGNVQNNYNIISYFIL